MIKAGEISEIIKRQLAGYEPEVDLQEVGRVIEVGDGIARTSAPSSSVRTAPSRKAIRSSAPTASPRSRSARRWWAAW